jgi:outer membrane receptor protein involved in Fe transport
VAVRGTYSTAFRAPTVNQLYSGQADSYELTPDPCDINRGNRSGNIDANCDADGVPEDHTDPQDQHRVKWGGNPSLDPETANIMTAGVVFTPTFVEGLTLTFDFFMIDIEDSIQRIGSDIIMNACYNAAPGERQYCDLIIRDPNTHMINRIIDTNNNIGGVETWGLDFQVRYDMKMNFGRFMWNFEGTYTGKYEDILSDGTHWSGLETYDLELVLPLIKFNAGVIWAWEGFGAGLNFRFIGGYEECEDNDCKTPRTDENDQPRSIWKRDVEANINLDLFVSYTLESPAGITKLTVGCNNVLDADPPILYNSFYESDAEYDFLGRYFYVRLSQMF